MIASDTSMGESSNSKTLVNPTGIHIRSITQFESPRLPDIPLSPQSSQEGGLVLGVTAGLGQFKLDLCRTGDSWNFGS